MVTMQHPAFPDIRREVDEEHADAWQASGWLPVDDTDAADRVQE